MVASVTRTETPKRTRLVLSRRVGETIVIGEGPTAIEIQVVEIKGFARLLVIAPQDVAVDRKEIRDRIEKDGRRKSALK